MRIGRWLAAVVLMVLVVPLSAQAGGGKPTSGKPDTGVSCGLPESDAEALLILNNFYPNRYYWDHTDLTVAVQAHPSATEEQLEAIHDAIATWSNVLLDCFDGLITLTDSTATAKNAQAADITLHYVPTAGGIVFAGYAVCGVRNCPNIIVRSDLPPSTGVEPYEPEYLRWVTLHELGHALGLGHATNLFESTDLMGYGWIGVGNAVLSDCDVDALAFIFAWALEGSEPRPPAAGPYDCSLD